MSSNLFEHSFHHLKESFDTTYLASLSELFSSFVNLSKNLLSLLLMTPWRAMNSHSWCDNNSPIVLVSSPRASTYSLLWFKILRSMLNSCVTLLSETRASNTEIDRGWMDSVLNSNNEQAVSFGIIFIMHLASLFFSIHLITQFTPVWLSEFIGFRTNRPLLRAFASFCTSILTH